MAKSKNTRIYTELTVLAIVAFSALGIAARVCSGRAAHLSTFETTNEDCCTSTSGTTSYDRLVPAAHSEGDGSGQEAWLSRCQHHLCTPYQQPAWYYLCNASNRAWSLTFIAGGYWPVDKGPRVERADEPVGHESWAGSIIRGLRALGSEAGIWNYNPSHVDMLNDVLWTDNCPGAREALRNGSAGRTKFIICGAVGTTFQNSEDYLDPAVGFMVVPSTWVADPFRGQSVSIRVLVSGVDEEFFKPSVPRKSTAAQPHVLKPGKSVILYLKTAGEHGYGDINNPFVQEVNNALLNDGWTVIPIVYNLYSKVEWRDALERAVAAIFMTSTESQSIAQAEAWSMDVPTFVLEASSAHPLFVYGRWWPQANEGPYINYMNGAKWSTVEGMLNCLKTLSSEVLAPRRYVLSTMTDKISVWNALRAIQCEWERRYPVSPLTISL